MDLFMPGKHEELSYTLTYPPQSAVLADVVSAQSLITKPIPLQRDARFDEVVYSRSNGRISQVIEFSDDKHPGKFKHTYVIVKDGKSLSATERLEVVRKALASKEWIDLETTAHGSRGCSYDDETTEFHLHFPLDFAQHPSVQIEYTDINAALDENAFFLLSLNTMGEVEQRKGSAALEQEEKAPGTSLPAKIADENTPDLSSSAQIKTVITAKGELHIEGLPLQQLRCWPSQDVYVAEYDGNFRFFRFDRQPNPRKVITTDVSTADKGRLQFWREFMALDSPEKFNDPKYANVVDFLRSYLFESSMGWEKVTQIGNRFSVAPSTAHFEDRKVQSGSELRRVAGAKQWIVDITYEDANQLNDVFPNSPIINEAVQNFIREKAAAAAASAQTGQKPAPAGATSNQTSQSAKTKPYELKKVKNWPEQDLYFTIAGGDVCLFRFDDVANPTKVKVMGLVHGKSPRDLRKSLEKNANIPSSYLDSLALMHTQNHWTVLSSSNGKLTATSDPGTDGQVLHEFEKNGETFKVAFSASRAYADKFWQNMQMESNTAPAPAAGNSPHLDKLTGKKSESLLRSILSDPTAIRFQDKKGDTIYVAVLIDEDNAYSCQFVFYNPNQETISLFPVNAPQNVTLATRSRNEKEFKEGLEEEAREFKKIIGVEIATALKLFESGKIAIENRGNPRCNEILANVYRKAPCRVDLDGTVLKNVQGVTNTAVFSEQGLDYTSSFVGRPNKVISVFTRQPVERAFVSPEFDVPALESKDEVVLYKLPFGWITTPEVKLERVKAWNKPNQLYIYRYGEHSILILLDNDRRKNI
jgi:hypothetical protein